MTHFFKNWHYNITSITSAELRQLFFDFAKTTERLPAIMQKANVDTDLIKRLESRIKDVTRELKRQNRMAKKIQDIPITPQDAKFNNLDCKKL